MKKLFIILGIVLFTIVGYGQAPSATCGGATLLTVNGACGTGTISDATIEAPLSPTSCGVIVREGWFRFVATQTTATVTTITTSRQLLVQVFSGACGSLTEIGCANANTTAGAQTEIVGLTGLTIGNTYYIRVANQTANNMALTSCCVTYDNGENCGTAMNLASMTSPYSSTTVGYLDDISTCRTGYLDRIFYIDVPNCNSIDIWESANSYDEYEYMGYGNVCPGATTINCWDNDALSHNIWTNGTGSTQRVWYVQDAYSGSGTFTLNWTLTAAPTLVAPTEGIHVPSGTQIIWNWNAVAGATGYRWSTTNNYATAIDVGNTLTRTETGLTCGVSYTRYIWAYNSCGNSVSTTITSTIPCPAANDECGTAIPLTVGTSCSYSTYSNVGATASVGVPAPGCANYVDDDVWFTAVVPTCGRLIIDTQIGGITDGGMAIYSGTCGSLTLIECDDDDSGNGAMSMIDRSGLTPSSTIYIRVWEYGGDIQGSFGICVYDPLPPCAGTPAAGTILAAPVTTVDCGNTSTLLTANGVTAGCGITYQWQLGPSNSGPWTNVVGATSTTLTVSPLVNTWYRIITTCTLSGLSNNSSWIKITSNITPPANDECINAINLFVNGDYNCGTLTNGTISCATPSSDAIAPCGGTADDDVWYSFIAGSANHRVSLINVAGSTTDMYHAVYSGTCGALTNIACNDGDVTNLTGLIVGNTYYVRVYTWTSTAGQTSTFDVCIGTPPPPPMNDEPCNAIVLPVNYGSCSYTEAYNNFATASEILQPTIPAPTCASYLGGDIWFKVTVPASGRLIIDSDDIGGPTDMGMAIYTSSTNSCLNINTLIECDDDQSTNGSMPMICRAGTICTVPGDCDQNATLASGTEVYIRMWEYGNDLYGSFDICAYEPAAPGAPSDCNNATVIATLPFSHMGETTCCRGNEITMANANACTSSYMDGEDYLYKYTPTSNVSIDITLTGTSSYTGLFVSDRCPSSGGANCVASATSISGNPVLCGVSLTAGTTYYIMIDTDPTPNCTPFNINITTSSTPTCGMNYSVSSVACNFEYFFGTNIVLPIDDRFCDAYIPFGFPFCYNGIQYSGCLVSSNGYLIFDPVGCATNLPTGNAAPNASSAWSISEPIPNTTDAPRNAILFPWHDINPAVGGAISYTTLGTAPNRRFIVSFMDAPMYSCTTLECNQQVKIYESTWDIEIHLKDKELCTSWNGGAAILGLHNHDGTQAVVVYNYPDQWSATNEAWRFTNNCGSDCVVPLPVELSAFYAECSNNKTILHWVTQSEKDNDYFTIEKSQNGINFYEIGTVKGIGNSVEELSYDYVVDEANNTYYRLSQTDYDGKKTIHDIIYANCHEELTISINPNPSNEGEIVRINGHFETIKIYDVLGAEVKFKLDDNKISDLSKGAYLIIIDEEKFKLIVK